MRLAEEEKLRKEMSAKKAKEEAERKHQVSGDCPSASLSIHWPTASRTLAAILSPLRPPFMCALGAHPGPGQRQAGGLWLQSARVRARRSTFSSWETAPP